ncbi:hypothetical protein [Pseudomonas sp. C11]|uniref:hypothetical protein n=1 Tax=Pseudomonas sp. C11 TaxID=3075550 RepID=UPI002AFFBD43|nr:hypothetical protein [Pseudomonas sp. C11]
MPMNEDLHHKEVYAYFGLAIYQAQVLEHGIVNALVYCDLIPNKVRTIRSKEEWAALFDTFMDGHFEKTLGKMIRTLKATFPITTELESKLAESLKLRNFLAHHYFKDRIHLFLSCKGREQMIGELSRAREQFESTDSELEFLIKPIREKHGFTDEVLQMAYNDFLNENSPII